MPKAVDMKKRAKFTCHACDRRFAALAIFDSHQDWTLGVLTCGDPGSMTTLGGQPRFVKKRGVWHRVDGSRVFASPTENERPLPTLLGALGPHVRPSETPREAEEGAS